MDAILHHRRIRMWEQICQFYTIPKSRFQVLDKAIREGEDIPPYKRVGKPSS